MGTQIRSSVLPCLLLCLWTLLAPGPARGTPPAEVGTGPASAEALAAHPALLVAWLEAQQRSGGAAYALAPAGAALRGQNAAHGFSVALDAAEGAVRLDAGGVHFALALAGIGRADGEWSRDVLPVDRVEHDGQKVSWRRGALTEWYLNGPLGLEQGFDLSERVPGAGEVVLSLTVSGEVTPVADGDAVRFATSDGSSYAFRDLLVVDADGRRLPSRMGVEGDRVTLRFDDRDARYPVLVDPFLAVEEQRIAAGEAAAGAFEYDSFGQDMSLWGDTAVIGAPGDGRASDNFSPIGAAYVFVRSGGTWTLQQKLVPDDAAHGDEFGFSVAVTGDTLLVGCPGDDTFGGTNAGSVYVYTRSGDAWTQQQKLLAGDPEFDHYFGALVRMSGDTALVTASWDGSIAGAVYAFVRSGDTWAQQQKLVASDSAPNARFGSSADLAGDTAVIGAPSGHSNRGAAYVFVRSGSTWSEQRKLTASDADNSDGFGGSVALSGDTVLVGAGSDDTDAGPNAGSAYVFVRSGTTWTEQQRFGALDGAAHDRFGTSVLLRGDTAVVAAPFDDDDADASGSAYVFVRTGSLWIQHRKFAASEPAVDGYFGSSLALSGDTLAVGAPNQTVDAGFAHLFRVGFDSDFDGVVDTDDNCPFVANPDQEDGDADGLGDTCDPSPDDPDPADLDGDGAANAADNCPFHPNPGQEDADGDGLGDVCDPSPDDPDPFDADGDGVANAADNCPFHPNAGQEDADGDGLGDACDPSPDDPDPADIDGDGVANTADNCPFEPNADQADGDEDGLGDACDDEESRGCATGGGLPGSGALLLAGLAALALAATGRRAAAGGR